MKKNILISVFDMEIGGIERSLINMLESFDYHKFNVDLFICEHKGDLMCQIPKKVNILSQINKYSVFRKPIKQCLKEGHYATSLIRIGSKFIAEAKARSKDFKEGSGYIQMQLVQKYASIFLPRFKKRYDVAISYAWPHDIVAKNVNAEKKIAWIHTDYSKLEIDNRLDLRGWMQFNHIISISDECTKSFLTKYPTLEEKVLTLENITSPNFINNLAQDHIPLTEINSKGNFNILSVGRLSYVKGFDMAVKALRLLHDKGLTYIKWYVIGYGGYESELSELISSYNLQDSFILLGKKINPYPYMKACDLYVQPSRYEGKAVTVTEAKILKKPIIITAYPTAKSQLINGVEGIICNLSVEGLSTTIEKLAEDKKERERLIENLKKFDYSNTEELNKLYQLIG
ncbi:glycosyltransferase [Metabacillus bambusae]|uniref:Glycosyltransferase n=1 Tax=Metabacillus bambusae TaxID=2795218 RepID=A0ABS3N235_9BACI|nr:glycosyltransferase [Metabacillus bambusae]MBO1512362.1 glycosyltransferase [Metabacillus bambusae]